MTKPSGQPAPFLPAPVLEYIFDLAITIDESYGVRSFARLAVSCKAYWQTWLQLLRSPGPQKKAILAFIARRPSRMLKYISYGTKDIEQTLRVLPKDGVNITG